MTQRFRPVTRFIATAAKELDALRNNWLNPPEWTKAAHAKLDAAVFAAYGWPADLSDDDLLARLLALNLSRAAATSAEGDEEQAGSGVTGRA